MKSTSEASFPPIQALLMGAFDYIIKPGGIGAKDLPRFREELLAKVLLASQSQ